MKILYDLSNSQVGPHGIRSYENVILTANNYNDTVSIFNKLNNPLALLVTSGKLLR